MFHVLILHARPYLKAAPVFEDRCASVILPGTEGEFEILDFHKPILSRLQKGTLVVDNRKEFKIKGGVIKMDHQSLVAIVDV